MVTFTSKSTNFKKLLSTFFKIFYTIFVHYVVNFVFSIGKQPQREALQFVSYIHLHVVYNYNGRSSGAYPGGGGGGGQLYTIIIKYPLRYYMITIKNSLYYPMSRNIFPVYMLLKSKLCSLSYLFLGEGVKCAYTPVLYYQNQKQK